MAVVTLAAMSQQVRAATITTSVGSDCEWPTYCGVGQTRNIVVQMMPPPPAGWFYQNCRLTITFPDGATIYFTNTSDSLGYVRYSFTPSQLGIFHLLFSFPGQNMTYDIYTDCGSPGPDWTVAYDPDTTPPSGTLQINAGASTTTTQLVNLNLYATDTQSEVWYMRFSNDGLPWSSWEDYSTMKAWTLSAGAGTKTVYVQFRDENLNPSAIITDQILLLGSNPLSVYASPYVSYKLVGESATFTATVSGGTPLYTYAWYEGAVLVGNSAQLTTTKTTEGYYSFYCTVWDSANSTATSNAVTLLAGLPLSVSASPSTISRTIGQSATFTATPSGGFPSYTYRWYEGTTIVGNSSQLTIPKNTAGSYYFYCQVTDSLGSTANSNTVTLVVTPPLAVSAGPLSISVEVGQSATFTATASGGTPPYTYQWIEGSTTVGTTATLTISRTTASTYSFYCRVTDSAASTQTSNTVTLIATTAPPPVTPLTASAAPLSISVEVGQSATFTATASGGTSPYTYQWIEGSTTVGNSATLIISKNTAGTYSFYCRITDSAGSAQNSNSVTLTATSAPPPVTLLSVSAAPSTVSREVGQSATFTATASGGTPPYTYQWIEGSTTVGTTATLTISRTTASTYSFYCRVTDSAASTQTSNSVTLTTTVTSPSPSSPSISPSPSASASPSPSPSSSSPTSSAIIVGAVVAAAAAGVITTLYFLEKGKLGFVPTSSWLFLNKVPSTVEVAEELEEKILDEAAKEIANERKLDKRRKDAVLSWDVSVPLMITPDPSEAVLEIQNRSLAAAKDVQIKVDLTSGIMLKARIKAISELRANEKQRLIFPFDSSPTARRGVYALRFEVRSRQTPTSVKKRFMRLSRIGVFVDPRNPVYALPLKNWLKANSYVWEEVVTADDFLKLLKYDLIILPAEIELFPRWLRNISKFVEEGYSVLAIDKMTTQEQEVLANLLGYKKMVYEPAKFKANLLTVTNSQHEITAGFSVGQGIPIREFWGNMCASELSTGQNLFAFSVKNEKEVVTILAVNVNRYEKGKVVHLNFHAEENLAQISALLRTSIDWLLSSNPNSNRETKQQ